MVGDIFHRGHLELIMKARLEVDTYRRGVLVKRGKLIIGLHPDDVVRDYKRPPVMSFEDRKKIIESVRDVDLVVEDCMDIREPTMFDNLRKHKVDVLVHGDDWLPPLYAKAKEEGYEVIQVPYWGNVSTTSLLQKIRTAPKFKRKDRLVVVSAGDAITAKLVERAGCDGIWVSGFEASARLGLVDNGTITMTEMLNVVKPIVDATNLPVTVDVDNGYGGIHNFIRCVKEFERIGVAAVCVEDNTFPKQNSLWGGKVPLLSMEEHGAKIKVGKEYKRTEDFKIIARTEALIRGYGMEEAIKRAEHYADCGADMILVHSREPTGKEALEIPKHWKHDVSLVIVPTKFPHITNKQLFDAGYSMVIWANQTERAKIKAIKGMLDELKTNDSAERIEKQFSVTLDDMRALTPMEETEEIDEKFGKV